MTLTKGFAKNNAKTPLDQRLADMATIVPNADGSPRVGVLYSGNASIVTALATMNVAVAAAEFVTSKGKADGVMIFTNDGTVNVPITAAPASNSRITVIWVKHNDDTTGDPAGQYLPVFGTTDGAAAASPTKPAIPTGALELATLRVYSGTTAANGGANTLTNTYQMTAPRHGVVPFRTVAELTAWTNPQLSQRAFVMGDKRIYTRQVTSAAPAGAWIPDRAGFFANRSSAQSLSPAGWWVISTAFAAPSLNDLGTWTGANGTLQVTHSGVYRVGGFIKLAAPSNPMSMQITQNSGAPDVGVLVEQFLNSSSSSLNAGALVTLNAGDVIRLLVFNTAATTVAMAQLSLELVALT